jgi:MraZ protein
MSYFSGEYECTIDNKGRMNLPARIKMRLPENHSKELFLVRGTDPCLVLYSSSEWEKLTEKLSAMNEFDPKTVIVQRNLMRGAMETKLDSQGRFLLSKRLLNYAGITKDVILVGLGNRLEIWEPLQYENYLVNDQNERAILLQSYINNVREDLTLNKEKSTNEQ